MSVTLVIGADNDARRLIFPQFLNQLGVTAQEPRTFTLSREPDPALFFNPQSSRWLRPSQGLFAVVHIRQENRTRDL